MIPNLLGGEPAKLHQRHSREKQSVLHLITEQAVDNGGGVDGGVGR